METSCEGVATADDSGIAQEPQDDDELEGIRDDVVRDDRFATQQGPVQCGCDDAQWDTHGMVQC